MFLLNIGNYIWAARLHHIWPYVALKGQSRDHTDFTWSDLERSKSRTFAFWSLICHKYNNNSKSYMGSVAVPFDMTFNDLEKKISYHSKRSKFPSFWVVGDLSIMHIFTGKYITWMSIKMICGGRAGFYTVLVVFLAFASCDWTDKAYTIIRWKITFYCQLNLSVWNTQI